MSPKHTGSAVKHSIIDVENEESETQQAEGSSGKDSGKEIAAPGVASSSKMASPLPTATTLASTPGAAHADNPFSAEESREVQVPSTPANHNKPR